MRCLSNKGVDHIPHKARALDSEEKVETRTLPPFWKWKDTLPELNTVNMELRLNPISISSLSKIKGISFAEYLKKTPLDNFVHCSTCHKFDSHSWKLLMAPM